MSVSVGARGVWWSFTTFAIVMSLGTGCATRYTPTEPADRELARAILSRAWDSLNSCERGQLTFTLQTLLVSKDRTEQAPPAATIDVEWERPGAFALRAPIHRILLQDGRLQFWEGGELLVDQCGCWADLSRQRLIARAFDDLCLVPAILLTCTPQQCAERIEVTGVEAREQTNGYSCWRIAARFHGSAGGGAEDCPPIRTGMPSDPPQIWIHVRDADAQIERVAMRMPDSLLSFGLPEFAYMGFTLDRCGDPERSQISRSQCGR